MHRDDWSAVYKNQDMILWALKGLESDIFLAGGTGLHRFVLPKPYFANLSLFMNNLTYLIYKDSYFSRYSINAIKSLFMAERYAKEALKFYGQNGDDILISDDILDIAQFSMIYRDTG